jgi:RNA polymerase sigma-70 factor (ECF subfamily)
LSAELATIQEIVMPDDPAFAVLMDRLRRGDPGAAEEIFRRFAGRLIGLARNHLDARVRRKVDPEEVMQSALKSFFLRQQAGAFDLADWDGLWALLTTITLRKCGLRTEHYRAQRRDVGREAEPLPEDEASSWQALARDPTPSEAAVLAETVERLLAGLDEGARGIAELALQGYKAPEISERVGVAERTVYRTLQRLRKRLERLRAEGED